MFIMFIILTRNSV